MHGFLSWLILEVLKKRALTHCIQRPAGFYSMYSEAFVNQPRKTTFHISKQPEDNRKYERAAEYFLTNFELYGDVY